MENKEIDITQDASKKESNTELSSSGALNVEKILKKYVIPTIEYLWEEFKSKTGESLTMTQTFYYTIENWVVSIKESKVYYVVSTTVYTLGGFAIKKIIYDPVEYFFGEVPNWVVTVSKKCVKEVGEIVESTKNYILLPFVDLVVFLDKSMGTTFYVVTIPPLALYKTLYLVYRGTQKYVIDIDNRLYDYFYSTNLPEDPNDVEDDNDDDDEKNKDDDDEKNKDDDDEKNKDDDKDDENSTKEKNLAWTFVETAVPTVVVTSVILLRARLLKII